MPRRLRYIVPILLALLALAAPVIWLIGRASVWPEALWPARGAVDVSTRAVIRIILNREPDADEVTLTLDPPHAGELRVQGREIVYTPATPLSADTTYTVTLHPDEDEWLIRPVTWHFTTRQPRVLYLAPDEEGNQQLWVASVNESNEANGSPAPLTAEPHGVWDYAVSPDGLRIAYAAERGDGGADLWLIDVDGGNRLPLADCAGAFCSGVSWWPDGRRLVYERDPLTSEGVPSQHPAPWVIEGVTTAVDVDMPTGEGPAAEPAPHFPDPQEAAHSARISADGMWIAYIAPYRQALVVRHLEDGRRLEVPRAAGLPAVWHPKLNRLLMTQTELLEESYITRLVRVDAETGGVVPLGGADESILQSYGVWSPDGERIAYGQAVWSGRRPLGRQIWIMDDQKVGLAALGGDSGARALTDDPATQHGGPLWSPDGRYLLYSRHRLGQLTGVGQLDTPEGLWLLDTETGAQRQVVPQGLWPAWLP
ncbi:MAG TPA: hypothetical protein GX702_08915 [Chloroflexi bacterium]|nr:hypothetical protein [Chloroflexota bacterium]